MWSFIEFIHLNNWKNGENCVLNRRKYTRIGNKKCIAPTKNNNIHIYIWNRVNSERVKDFSFNGFWILCIFLCYFSIHSLESKINNICCLMCIGFKWFHWIQSICCDFSLNLLQTERFVSMWNLHTPTVYVLSIVSESMRHFGIFRWYVVVVENKITEK